MKKLFSLICLLVLAAGSAFAQKMVVRTADKQVVMYDITQVESVAFVDEYVDLGLPSGTLWASCNVGANSPEEAGDYFAWGETQTKDNYGSGNYFDSTDGTTFVKYNVDGGLTELQPEDDAATANLNAGWQMPSKAQIDELMNSSNTITIWMKQNGVDGFMVISRNNSNHIFLPAAGFCWGAGVKAVGSDGYYWTRSLSQDSSNAAEIMYFTSSGLGSIIGTRAMGFSIRPVVCEGQKIPVEEIVLNYSTLSLQPNATQQLTATVKPVFASNKAVIWTSSNSAVATVSTDGLVTANAEGTCTITCSATDSSGIFAECQVRVKEADIMEYVDLGLPSGTQWATCNVGASSPEKYGDYFAWGEKKPKRDYDWKTYTFTDNPEELQAENDAATVNWGDGWQMPSSDQMLELLNNTTAEWTTLNGVYGRKITSKNNGNSIFLPAAGWRGGTDLIDDGSIGYYLSRSLDPFYDNCACCLKLDSNGISMDTSNIVWGSSVRPVRKQ